MGALLGFLSTLLGISLLISGLFVPRPFFTTVWQTLLAILFLGIGLVAANQHSEAAGKPLAGLTALLGICLAIAGIAPLLLGLPLYGSMGSTVRIIIGVFLTGAGYLIYEFGGEIFGYDDDDF